MGVSLICKKTGTTYELGMAGFMRLRRKMAELAGDPIHSHYEKLFDIYTLPLDQRKEQYEAFDNETERLISEKLCNEKILDFLLQSDTGGSINYGACKDMLAMIGNYTNGIIYGYPARHDPFMFWQWKSLLAECVANKSKLVWN